MAQQRVDIQLHIFRSPKLVSVVEEAINFFNKTPFHRLPPESKFTSGGVYALYYVGDFKHYEQIAASNRHSYRQPLSRAGVQAPAA